MRYLVTGGAGFVGSEIVKQLLEEDHNVIAFDNNPHALAELKSKFPTSKLQIMIGDVRDKESVMGSMIFVEVCFHAAALKDVPLCEKNPIETMKTNILGTHNVIECAKERGLNKVIFISTDKAVSPISTMGVSKLFGERLIITANDKFATKFSCVRFGNVLNSTGSILPIWSKQFGEGKPLTITDDKMTRFFMSIRQAVELIRKCEKEMEGAEIFILKMDALSIKHLATAFLIKCQKCDGDYPREYIGIRPGEKTHEMLYTEEESYYIEEKDDIFILRPNTKPDVNNHVGCFSSEYAYRLDVNEILDVLEKEKIL